MATLISLIYIISGFRSPHSLNSYISKTTIFFSPFQAFPSFSSCHASWQVSTSLIDILWLNKKLLCNSFVHGCAKNEWAQCTTKNKDITHLVISIWCGHLGPSIMQQHDGACSRKVCPGQLRGSCPIPPGELSIVPPCCMAMDCEHIWGHPIDPIHALWYSYWDWEVAMRGT